MLKPDLPRRSLIKGLAATALAPALLRLAALGEVMVARRWHAAGRRRYTQVCLPHQPFRRCYGGCHSRCGAVGCAPRPERRPGAPVDGERSTSAGRQAQGERSDAGQSDDRWFSEHPRKPPFRWSSAMSCTPLRCCPNAGSSNAPSVGWKSAEGSGRTANGNSIPACSSFPSPSSASYSEDREQALRIGLSLPIPK